MSRVYATEEDTGRRFLLRLECDAAGCLATIEPHPEITQSGWMRCGYRDRSGTVFEYDYCPEHAHIARRFAQAPPRLQ